MNFQNFTSDYMNWKSLALYNCRVFPVTVGYYFYSIRNALVATVNQKPVWEVVTRNGSKTNLLLPDGSSCLSQCR